MNLLFVIKVTMSWDGDKLRGDYEPKEAGKGKRQYITREIQGDQLIVVSKLINAPHILAHILPFLS